MQHSGGIFACHAQGRVFNPQHHNTETKPVLPTILLTLLLKSIALGWRGSSVGRLPAYRAQGPRSSPQYHIGPIWL